MGIQEAYDNWAPQYDSNRNRTRDLEAVALRITLKTSEFEQVLEIGCGTGKNTIWLAERAKTVTAADFSEAMLQKAREKVVSKRVQFIQADISLPWPFQKEYYDLITFSLVLEHIGNLEHVFCETSKCLKKGGMVYIGELHPFKQYSGTKARFDTADGRQEVECFTHHISDFTNAAKKAGLSLVDVGEYFDENDRGNVPRILVLLLKKNG